MAKGARAVSVHLVRVRKAMALAGDACGGN